VPKKGSTIQPIILHNAIACFGDRGYDGVTTRDLAAAADVTESSIYDLFDSKENLYQMAIRDVISRGQQSMGQVLLGIARSPQSTSRKQVVATIRGWYETLARADARLLQNVLKQATSYDKKFREQARAPFDEIKAIISGLLQGKLKGKSPAKATLSAEVLLWALFQQKVIQAGLQPSNEESQKVNALIENWIDVLGLK
jgi:AcrR family transcriptional regulator